MNKEKTKNEMKNLVSEIAERIISTYELYEIAFIYDNLKRENEDRTEKEVIAEAIKEIIRYKEDYGYEDNSDAAHDWAESNVEIHTTELFKIYSLNPYYITFIDEARAELGEDENIEKQLQAGIYLRLYYFAEHVLYLYEKLKEEVDKNE